MPPATDRIHSLDTIRGIAVLGILMMNAVSFALGTAPYFNVSAGGIAGPLDWVLGGVGDILVDQKFMGMFSMLFGAGIVVFCDRAVAKERSPMGLSLWRNTLLLAIGIAHSSLWEGDVLMVYAIVAPAVLLARRLPPGVLAVAGVFLMCVPALLALWAQDAMAPDPALGLGEYWKGDAPIGDEAGLFLIGDFFCRALGMMLIGVASYRNGFLTGQWSNRRYGITAAITLPLGLLGAAAGYGWLLHAKFAPDIALLSTMPNTLTTPLACVGYASLIILWSNRSSGAVLGAVRAVGKTALTNYLLQTALGLAVFQGLATETSPTRSQVFAFVLCVWGLQLVASPLWLRRFRMGPAEWLWRCATYARWHPLRR